MSPFPNSARLSRNSSHTSQSKLVEGHKWQDITLIACLYVDVPVFATAAFGFGDDPAVHRRSGDGRFADCFSAVRSRPLISPCG